MTLRLTDAELAALRETAEREHRSMHDVVRTAVAEYTSRRVRVRDELLDEIVTENAEALQRLADA